MWLCVLCMQFFMDVHAYVCDCDLIHMPTLVEHRDDHVFLFLHHFSTMLFEKTSLIEPGAQLLTRLVCQWAQWSIHLCPPHYSTTIWSSPFIYVLGIPNQVFMFCVANILWAESFLQTIKIFLIVSLIFLYLFNIFSENIFLLCIPLMQLLLVPSHFRTHPILCSFSLFLKKWKQK